MKIAIAGSEQHRAEWQPQRDVTINWHQDASEFDEADVYIDLLFDGSEARVAGLQKLLPALVIINSVNFRLAETDARFIRFNGWPTMAGEKIEAAGAENFRPKAEEVFRAFGKEITWVADVTGFVTPRIISMIINEAYLAREEGLSTQEDIDRAMKLGTAYPYGPFEWAEKIGTKNIFSLLRLLSQQEARYQPAPGLAPASSK